MPLYELLCIARHDADLNFVRNFAKSTIMHILDAGGVVRGINHWGTKPLPQRMWSHKNYHSIGDYFTIHFDTSPRTIESLRQIVRRDPLVVRWTVLRLGSRVEDILDSHEQTTRRQISSARLDIEGLRVEYPNEDAFSELGSGNGNGNAYGYGGGNGYAAAGLGLKRGPAGVWEGTTQSWSTSSSSEPSSGSS